MSPCFQVLE